MATKSAKSTRDYGLWYGISVGGLDKDSGIKLSEEIANLLETDGSKCYEAADFILDNSLPKQAVFADRLFSLDESGPFKRNIPRNGQNWESGLT